MVTHPLVDIVHTPTADDLIPRRHVHFQLTPSINCNSEHSDQTSPPFSLTGKPRLLVGHHAHGAVDDVIVAHFSLPGGLRPPVGAHLLSVVDVVINHCSLPGNLEPPVSSTKLPPRAEEVTSN